jgi:hypothetical protein
VALLLATFNPRIRITTRPEGDVDWGGTLSLGPRWPEPEFALKSSGLGIGEMERDAVIGWASWLCAEWVAYGKSVRLPVVQGWELLAAWSAHLTGSSHAPPSREALTRWAHLARRSRWPLLRNVVAETLRPALEPQDLDSLPLPRDRAALFELLCLVRLVRALVPRPRAIRWFDSESGNTAFVDGLTLHYQGSLDRDRVLACSEFPPALRESMRICGVPLPLRPDGRITFDTPRGGFGGLIIEAKSGSQNLRSPLLQMKVYRASIVRRTPDERYLVWGIVEQLKRAPLGDNEIEALRQVTERNADEDGWIFSGADEVAAIAPVLLRA